jgi:serine/threonine-protein kinase
MSQATSIDSDQGLLGREIGNYKITEWLGRGGAAEVYRAIEQPLERPVALKIMTLDNDGAADPNFASRFLVEARAIAALHHPNIITVYQYGEWEQRPYLATELMEGGSLADKLDDTASLSLDETLALIAQVGAALEVAHSRNIVHRDVKPSNVLLDGQGRAVLADFGIAKVLTANDNITMTGMSIGTPEYMSPEQAMGQPVDRRSDIYSLGVLTYRLLTGRCPFENESALAVLIAHSRETPPAPRSFNPAIPLSVEQVVLRCLAKLPAERYQSAAQFVNALQNAAGKDAQISAQVLPSIQPEANSKPKPATAEPTPNYQHEAVVPVYAEPTAINPSAPRPQRNQRPPNYQPAEYIGDDETIYNKRPYVSPAQRQTPHPSYTTPSGSYPVARPAVAKPRPKKRWGVAIAALVVGILLAAAVFVGVWLLFLKDKTSNTVFGNPSDNNSALVSSRLLFGSTRNNKWDIYSASYTGTDLKKIVSTATDDISPVLSPDGKVLVYISAPGLNTWSIHKVNWDGTNDVTLTDGKAKDEYPAWSPDGKRLVFLRNNQLFIMDANGQNQRKLNNDLVGFVSWNPGSLIVYSYANAGGHGLRTLNPDNGQVKDLSAVGAGDFDFPLWSPDGKKLAFVKGRDDARAVYTSNLDGSGAVRFSPTGQTATNPAWSPDGQHLAYLQKVGMVGGFDKWEVTQGNSDASNLQRLFNDGQQKFYLSWGAPK